MKTRFTVSSAKKLGSVSYKAGVGSAGSNLKVKSKPVRQATVKVNYEVPKPSGLQGKM